MTLHRLPDPCNLNVFKKEELIYYAYILIFMGIFGTQKMWMCTLICFLGGGVSESVWFVHS